MDTVEEVHDIPGADIEPPPEFGASVATDFILAMGTVKDDVKILLDIERVLTAEKLVHVQAVNNSG